MSLTLQIHESDQPFHGLDQYQQKPDVYLPLFSPGAHEIKH
jgi:hypothetical protein